MQIKHIASYVNEKISDPNSGAQHFDPNKSRNIKPNYKRIGQHFGHTSSTPANKNTEPQNSELKMQLFQHALKVMKKKGVNVNKIARFTDCMVSITINNCNGVDGHIQCILCKNPGKREPITVQSKIGNQSKLY